MKKLVVVLLLLFSIASYAETQTINWWVGGQSYQTTTCETAGNVTPPATPTKRGHHFTGWEVALYDFSTLDASIQGIGRSYYTANRTWSVTFDYGVVYGTYLCSVTSGSFAQTGTPVESGTGVNCWCKATAYKPTGSSITYENISLPAWIYHHSYNSESDCESGCLEYCGTDFKNISSFRRGVFGITQ